MNLFEKNSIEEIKELLKSAKNIVVTAHFNPDGDALGSALCLYNILKDSTNCHVIFPNHFPDTFGWMPGSENILIYNAEQNADILANADVLFCLDYNCGSRVEKMQKNLENSPAIKIMIDHHPSPQQDLCKYVFSDSQAAATCELLYFFCVEVGLKINNDAARCLFTGLTTDTGCFQFNSTSQRTFEVAAKLASYPIDRAEIIHHIFDSYSESRMRLQGYVLQRKMRVYPHYHAAYIALSYEEAEKFNYQVGDSEGFANLPLSIETVKFSAFFMERDGIIRCSFRSKGDFKVNEIAERYFNGGGHDNAAGGKSYKSLDEIVNRFISILPKVTKPLREADKAEKKAKIKQIKDEIENNK
mgnify:CR=1 FL=1